MTPVSLNPPGPSIQGQNLQLFNSPHNQDCHASLFNLLDRRQTIGIGELRENDHQDIDKLVVWHDGSSSNNQLYNSTIIPQSQPVMDNSSRSTCDPNLPSSKMEEEDIKNSHGSEKWMSSKMRLMRKMMRPSSSSSTTPTTAKANNTTTIPCPRLIQNQGHDQNRYSQRSPRNNNNSSNNTTRVCSDCNTSSTPLWRGGPNGPKSLCNACGIRQRKARRAMAEAANGLSSPISAASSTKTKVHNKEKKPRTNHFAQFKNKSKSTSSTASSSQEARKLECFKDFAISLRNNSSFMEVFPRDEVAEAALLLMDLSCGYVHS